MQTQDKTKSFAFKLATDSAQKDQKQKLWQVRDGVAVAGCTDPTHVGDFRYSSTTQGRDRGVWC